MKYFKSSSFKISINEHDYQILSLKKFTSSTMLKDENMWEF